jgi:hypothetical protein
VDAKPLEQTRDSSGADLGEMALEVGVSQALDLVLAAKQGDEKRLICGGEEVEALVAAAVLDDGIGDLGQCFVASDGVVDGGEEVEVALVGSAQKPLEIAEAILSW